MTERHVQGVAVPTAATTTPPTRAREDEIERALGRVVARVLPLATIFVAIAVGFLAGVGSGLLIVAAGGLIGAVGLFWASLRTLSGDAPLASGFEALERPEGDVDALEEEKRRLLRALKDLESEHEIGKIDDADYEEFVAKYRNEAKVVMRRMDGEVAPFREEAERIAREYLRKQGLDEEAAGTPARPPLAKEPPAEPPPIERVACAACGTSNEPDAAFCKKCGASLKKEAPDARA
ncbi:MAG TPA: hypothetical protein VGM06_11915 [Polyangiaceae bacterium]|jgi:hypothetical protein